VRALLVGRRNAVRRPGGDSLQIAEAAAVLRAGGWSVVVENDPALVRPRAGDTVVLHNIQRCPDWGDLPERVAAAGARLALVPLFHPLERYHREGRQGLDGLAARWVRDPMRFASLRWGSEDLVARAAGIVSACDVVLLAHAREADALEAAFGVRPRRSVVVPPGVPGAVPRVDHLAPFPEFLLCTGRVEPLKNPLGVLDVAEALELPVVFAGALPGLRHAGYGRRFLARLHPDKAVHLGPVSPSIVRALMRQARVHVLASWTEVMGRVSVEAALEGAAVVATDVGFLPDLLSGPGLTFAPPGDIPGLRAAVGTAWLGGRPDGALAEAAKSLTWDVVGPQLLDALA
jgi:glycosyltransferase involved in cell wall biosynthesis